MPTWSTIRRSIRELLRPLLDGHADAVFGSRYLAGEQMRVLPFWHSMINKGLTLISNMFCNLNLTDMETCYKVFRTDLLKSIPDPLRPVRLRAGDHDEVRQAEASHLRGARSAITGAPMRRARRSAGATG